MASQGNATRNLKRNNLFVPKHLQRTEKEETFPNFKHNLDN